MVSFWRNWKYKNLTILALSILIAIFLSKFEAFHSFLLNLGGLGYLGAFIAGILFVSTFTVATGTIILLVLAEQLSAVEMGIIAGLGAVVGDLTIFRFIKNSLVQELIFVYNHIAGKDLSLVLKSKYFGWTLPVIGALLIASPLPDEIGVSLMGISQMKTGKFILISFVLNSTGIFLIVSASNFFKP